MPKRPKRPKDSASLAKLVVEIASGERPNDPLPGAPKAAAVSRGLARASALSPTRRKAIAKGAAKARWSKRA
jgi:hypothetical protein